MTLLEERPEQVEEPERRLIEVIPAPKNKGILAYLTSTDHKQIGINYMVTSFIMFLIAGAMAILMRVQLAVPNNNFVSLTTFNELFTIHGTIMLFLFLGPSRSGQPTTWCLYRSARPTWPSPGSMPFRTGFSSAVASPCSPASCSRQGPPSGAGSLMPR